MPSPHAPFSITLDTHDPEGMALFYTERFGFEHTDTNGAPAIYVRTTLVNRELGVQLVLRDCLPRPPIGSVPGSLFEITLLVDDPEVASEGLEIKERSPAEGRADTIEVRDPGNYKLILKRAGA